MSVAFAPQRGLIIVEAEVEGPTGKKVVHLVLDTGATRTSINKGLLVSVGYDPAAAAHQVPFTTGSGGGVAPRIRLSKFRALGQERTNFLVLCHTLPPNVRADGLLGLDFFRGQSLTIDFRTGLITLA
jgi:aspartyl protease family protein